MSRVFSSLCLILLILYGVKGLAQQTKPRFSVIAIAEHGDQHQSYVDAARPWLDKLARDSNFSVTYIENADSISENFLSRFQLFIQLNYPPYRWSDAAKAAFEKYIKEGKIGWIGMHHATLLGDFDGFAIWPWFQQFMGGITFKNYIASFVDATVMVEDKKSPFMKNLPDSFRIVKEEFYTYDKSPRGEVHVLASVNENSYTPDSKVKMGDHPVIWTNEKVKARNIYIFMGHHGGLFGNDQYTTLLRNAIFWASSK